ncbi:hypothetical protein QMT40_000058 [Parvibaculaceae bacterium PLY_AMNH_Bact1]|nr:hypothetical protein QMT40_000058 [Parvibaculaceae bacterium PLY_AMNH_Bact1]
MAGIDRYLADGEILVYESRFGFGRLMAEIILFVVVTLIGLAFGPAIILAWAGFVFWVVADRKSNKVYVTNKRLIRKKGAGSQNFEELRLDKVESIKNGPLGLRVIGTGATVLKLPSFLSNITELRKALAV